jgi:tRNA dimethylallyltransferase
MPDITNHHMTYAPRSLPQVIVICGPTGIGKTALAIDLAESFHGEIISADSMQIYRHMNIGTAKPTQAERGVMPHHMVDIVDPNGHFDAALFSALAREKIHQLHRQGITPFIVGGTGFYIKALIHGIFQVDPTDSAVRVSLKKEADEKGTAFLYQRLSQHDPEMAKNIHPNDTYRIIRAIEIFEITGKPLSEHHQEHKFEERCFHSLKIGLFMERQRLYGRINRRVDAMMAEGLVEEVKHLLEMGYSSDLKPLQSIGYRHVTDFLKGNLSWEETIRTLKRDTRRYAKRQITWFKADPEIVWLEPEKYDKIHQLTKNFLDLGSHSGKGCSSDEKQN